MRFKTHHEYGSVDGDVNAKAIFEDRSAGQSIGLWSLGIGQVAILSCAVAYGTTGKAAWLAGLIVASVWFIAGVIHQAAHPLMTWLQVVERRAQLLEQDANEIDDLLRIGPRD